MPKQKSRPFTRKSKFRDAKSIVIATEGEFTEPVYFEAMALDDRFRHPRVKVRVLPTISGFSSPKHVIKRLNKISREYNLAEGDELWLVIDKDRIEDRMLSEVAQQARQSGYHLADSNPCIELWLLLHHRTLNSYTESELEALKENKKERFRSSRRRLESELIKVCGSYNKTNPNSSHYLPHINTAIENAFESDSQPETRWLNSLGSRVYKLAQSIIDSSPNNPNH